MEKILKKKEYRSPLQIIIIVGILVLAIEGTMAVLSIYVIPMLQLGRYETILDPAFEIISIALIIYFFLIRSLISYINKLKLSEQEIRLLQTLSLKINSAKNMKEALKTVLKEICDATEWDYGEVWMPFPDKALHETKSIWYSPSLSLKEFHNKSEEITFQIGVGLPGRIWQSKRSEWLNDVSVLSEKLFGRAELAKRIGLKAGLGVPVLAGEKVVAVMIFFMFQQRKEDKHLVEIISAVAAQLGTFFLKKQAEDTVKHMAFHDSLTGLPNLRLFRDFSDKAIAFAERNDQKIAVLFIDLDRFKNVNDTLGHDAGDSLLKEIGERLKSCVRKTDIVARVGGDEFIALLVNPKDYKNISKIAAEIVETLSIPLIFQKTEVNVTPSIGVSNYPIDGKNINVLINKADSAMRIAKNAGGGVYQFYDELSQKDFKFLESLI